MKLTIALVAWAFLATGMSVKAQSGRSFGNGTLPEFLKPYDTNNDGVLSAEEREAARKGLAGRTQGDISRTALDKWDLNGDGVLSPTEIEAARKACRDQIDAIRKQRFTDADTDADGFLSLAEFTASVPKGMPAAEVTKLFNFLDVNKDSKISLAEFLVACPQPPPPPAIPPLRLLPFFVVDTNHDGIISPEEFSAFLKMMPGLTADEIAAMFAKLDANTDNGITPDEWPVKDPGPPPAPPTPQALPAFAVADKNANNSVDPMEFAMAACASHIPALVARDMFRKADINADGKLAKAEYDAIPAPTTPPAPTPPGPRPPVIPPPVTTPPTPAG